MPLLEAVQRHLHRHPTGLAEMFFGGTFDPFGLKLLLTDIACTDTGVIAGRIFLMFALRHSVGRLGFSLCVSKQGTNATRKSGEKNGRFRRT